MSWRVVPSRPEADPTTDCPEAAGLRITLPGGPIDLGAPLAACGAGSVAATDYRPAV